jgi:PadR family transcriptional regulator PadR
MRKQKAAATRRAQGRFGSQLETIILHVLASGPRHGYGIIEWLSESSAGIFDVPEGSMYPALKRLEHSGFITSASRASERGRRARLYTLTRRGRADLTRQMVRFRAVAAILLRRGTGAFK